MISDAIYILMGTVTAVVTFHTYRTAFKTGDKSAWYMAHFFAFITANVFGILFSSYLVNIANAYVFTYYNFALRFLSFFGLLSLLNTIIFLRFAVIRENKNFIGTVLALMFVIGLFVAMFDFHPADNIGGTNIYNLNPISGLLLGLPSIIFGLVGGYSFFTANKDAGLGSTNNINHLFGIAAILLGLGDFIYMLAQNEMTSFISSLIGSVGYWLFVTIIVINHFKKQPDATPRQTA